MRILLVDLLEDKPNVTVDGRARLRGKQHADICRVFRVGSYVEAMRLFNYAVPSVVVKEDGSVVVFDSGGSGQIWVCNSDDLSSKQLETIDEIQRLYLQLGVSVVFDEPVGSIWLTDVPRSG